MEYKPEHIEAIKQRDDQWYEEIKKYLPAIEYMSFCGPEATMKWVFDKVGFQPKASFWPKIDSPAEKDVEQEKEGY